MKYFTLGLIASTLSLNIYASELNYDFIEASYIQTDIDNINEIKPTGFNLAASKEFTDWYLTVNYGAQSDKYSSTFGLIDDVTPVTLEFDLTRYAIGAGYIHSLSETTKLDYSLQLGQIKAETTVFSESESDTADTLLAQAQLRHLITDNIELNGTLGYERLHDDESENNFVAKVGAQYFFDNGISLATYYRDAGDYSDIALNIRYNF